MDSIKKQSTLPSICFVALNCYGILVDRTDIQHIGGAEVQQKLIAQWLVKRGFSVSFITLDHGQPDAEVYKGIKIFKAYNQKCGIPVLRFLYPRWVGLCDALARANADIYYQRCADSITGQIALWCRMKGRPFVFASASERDCISMLPALTTKREKVLFKIGLNLAEAVLVQTEKQQVLMKDHFSVISTKVRNSGKPLDCKLLHSKAFLNKEDVFSVLWVGRFVSVKRFHWLLDIAEKCTDIRFDVVGSSSDGSDYASYLTLRAISIPNVFMHGYVPYSKMHNFYKSCKVLCCTSIYEGFPNTFLEAWRMGVPVISTYDPDSVIFSEGLGCVAASVDDIVVTLREITKSPETLRKISMKAKKIYLKHYTLEANMPELEKVFLKVASGKRQKLF